MANEHLKIPFQRGLLREVLRRPADVVIGEGFFQWSVAALAKRLIQRVPLVISYQRTAHTERNCPYWRSAYRKIVVRATDAIVCNGTLSAEYSASLGMPPERIIKGGNTAETDSMRLKCEAVTESDKQRVCGHMKLTKPIFLYVGQIVPRKGVAELLLGWEIYKRRKHGRGSLLLVGAGNQRDSLEGWAKRRGLENVHFTGAAQYEDVATYYALADVFVIATLEDNWSIVMPEAMACGLPVACSKYNGCWPELVRVGENGVVFDPHEPEEIANSLNFFCERLGSLCAMGRASQKIVAGFSPTSAASAILKACEVASSHRRRRIQPPR